MAKSSKPLSPRTQTRAIPTSQVRAELTYDVTRLINEILAIDSEFCTTIRCEENVSYQEIERLFQSYRAQVLDLTSRLFTLYTGDKCAVCVKSLNLTDDRLWDLDWDHFHLPMNVAYDLPFVYTFARDSASSQVRRKSDAKQGLGIYAFTKNTGLARALEQGYWFCNDLGTLGDAYENVNDDWPNLYNATAIAALKYPSKDAVIYPLGLLCVDNKKGGFDDLACRQIMEIIANILYYTLRLSISISAEKGNGHGKARN